MGNQSPPESAETVIGEVEVAVIAVTDEVTGETVPLTGQDGGLAVVSGETLSVALDEQNSGELDVNVASPNVLDVDLSEQSLAELDVNVVSPDVLDVDLAEQSVGDLGVDLSTVGGTDQTGADIAAAIDALADALASAGTETLQTEQQSPVAIEGDDDGGTTATVQADTLDAALAGGEAAVITYPARALASVGADELVARVADADGTQVNPLAEDDLPLGVDPIEGAYQSLLADREYTAAERVTGVADATEVIDIVIQNPAGSGVNAVVTPTFTTTGSATIDLGTDIAINAAGTAYTDTGKDIDAASNTALTIEYDGDYATNGTTLENLLPGSFQGGGPATASGGFGSDTAALLLRPGSSIRYVLTNVSGSEASFGAQFDVVESPV